MLFCPHSFSHENCAETCRRPGSRNSPGHPLRLHADELPIPLPDPPGLHRGRHDGLRDEDLAEQALVNTNHAINNHDNTNN